MTQVVIVGAGPTGASLALLLIKQGITVKLVEASRDFQRLFRGEGLMPSGLDALAQMDLLQLLPDIPHQSIDAWEFILEGKTLFRVDEPIEIKGKPCTTVSQPHLLAKMIEQAHTYPQFELIQGQPVKDLVINQDRVTGVQLASDRQINADLVIAADGRNSVLRNKAGINFTKLQSKVNILWFKLEPGELAKAKNIFYSILQGRDGFGLFRASQGQLHLGWGLHADDDLDWHNIDWAKKLIETSPPWLATHIHHYRDSLTKPILLSVIVGRCDRWWQPGLLLLGDAVHPMSPIRAQGINMAFRDAIVAANYLVPLLSRSTIHGAQLDAVLPLIQQEREPEIKRIQQLQAQEMVQAELLHYYGLVRWGATTFRSIIRPGIRASWLKRQQQLRQGVTTVALKYS